MQEEEYCGVLDEFSKFVKDTYYADKIAILSAINEFCVEKDIDFEVDYDDDDDDDIELFTDEDDD